MYIACYAVSRDNGLTKHNTYAKLQKNLCYDTLYDECKQDICFMAIIHYAFASLYCIMINTSVIQCPMLRIRGFCWSKVAHMPLVTETNVFRLEKNHYFKLSMIS